MEGRTLPLVSEITCLRLEVWMCVFFNRGIVTNVSSGLGCMRFWRLYNHCSMPLFLFWLLEWL